MVRLLPRLGRRSSKALEPCEAKPCDAAPCLWAATVDELEGELARRRSEDDYAALFDWLCVPRAKQQTSWCTEKACNDDAPTQGRSGDDVSTARARTDGRMGATGSDEAAVGAFGAAPLSAMDQRSI